MDQHAPCLIGANGDCALVIRIEDGSFADLKDVLLAQFEMGLRLRKGSVGICLILTHLMKIGFNDFWDQFIAFGTWAETFGLRILPSLPPFPIGHSMTELNSVKQFITFLQLSHFGKLGEKNVSYSLWSPLTLTLSKHGTVTSLLHGPPPH